MPDKFYAVMWKITLLGAAGLCVATLILAYQARSLTDTGLDATLTGSTPTVSIWEQPSSGSKILTLLERGSRVNVVDAATVQDTTWVKIDSGRSSGWVPIANVVFEGQ